MNLKEFNNDLKVFYLKSSKVFEKLFDTYTFVCYDISEHQKVYVIEDSFVVYFGIKKICKLTNEYYATHSFDNNYEKVCILAGHLLIVEELTYNDIFKVNATKLKKDLFGKDAMYAPYIYKFFTSNIDKPIRSLNSLEEEEFNAGKLEHLKSNFHAVSKTFPFLQLKNRVESWKGIPYTFIIYEVEYNNKKGYAVNTTTSPYTTNYALNSIREMEKSARNTFLFNGKKEDNIGEPMDIFYIAQNIENVICYTFPYALHKDYSHRLVCWNDALFPKILIKKLKDYCEENNIKKLENIDCPKFIPDEFLKYWIFQDYVKTTCFHEKIIDILSNIEKYILAASGVSSYHKAENRWKSEELMYECIKKVFSKNEVVHQHRPYFLHTKSGQMSYDVFVYGEKIAFEYQGKQHFEPVEYFGGEEHFAEQRKRDALKQKLSDDNGIILIYVNYWENISTELIKEKIIDAFKQKRLIMNKYYLR